MNNERAELIEKPTLEVAAKKALTALEDLLEHGSSAPWKSWEKALNATVPLRQALLAADAQGGEPVARVEVMNTGGNAGLATRIVEIYNPHRYALRPGALLYTHPRPQAVAQGWKLPYVDRSEAVNLARNYLYSSLCKPLTQAGAEILAHAVLKMDAAMLSASPAAPEGAKPEREIEQLIRERDQRDEIIDRLCDAVLGSERPEWSSTYGFDDAVADVEARITQLHQPSVDKAWKRFEQANAAQPPHPQPQAQPTPSADDIHSCGEFCDLPECVAAREAQAQGGPQVLARIEKRFGGVRIVAGDGSPFDMAKYVGSQFITLQSHREAIAQHRAAMEESVEALRHLSQNARVSGAEMGLALVVAKDAITHANQVLEGKK